MTTSYDPRDILAARIDDAKTPTLFVVLEAIDNDTYIIDQLNEHGERLGQPRQTEIFDRFRASFPDMQLDNLVYRHDQRKFAGSIEIDGEVIPSAALTLTDGENEIKAQTLGDLFNKITDEAFATQTGTEAIANILTALQGMWWAVTDGQVLEAASAVWGVPADQIQLTR